MNPATLSSYFVRVNIPLKNSHTHRTGLIVAYDSRKDEPQTEDLLLLAYVTNEEKKDLDSDKDKSPWEINFLFEGIDKFKPCEVRSWEKADDNGHFALLAEHSDSDEGRRYEAFEHFKKNRILRPHDRGVVVWTLPDIGEIQTNIDRQADGKPLTYRLEKQQRNDAADIELGAAGAQPGLDRAKTEDLCQSLVGAIVFRDNGEWVGCCSNIQPKAELIKMDCTQIDFEIALALEKCSESRMHKAFEMGLIDAEALAKACTEIKEHLLQPTSTRNLSDIKNDFGEHLHKEIFPYFNRVPLERFLLHARSGLKHLLKSSKLLVKWREMLSSLHRIGRTSLASLALLSLLSGSSANQHAIELAKLHGPALKVSLDTSPLYRDSLRITDEDIIALAVFIRSIQNEEPRSENKWHKAFGTIDEKEYRFALDLRDALKAKNNKQALCELMDKYYLDEENEHRRRHIDPALALHYLAMPEADKTTLPSNWRILVEAIEKDIFCLN